MSPLAKRALCVHYKQSQDAGRIVNLQSQSKVPPSPFHDWENWALENFNNCRKMQRGKNSKKVNPFFSRSETNDSFGCMYACVCSCVCVSVCVLVCAHVYVCVLVCIQKRICRGQRLTSDIFLSHFSFLFFWGRASRWTNELWKAEPVNF